MSRLGSRLIAVLAVVLLAGAAWFLVAKKRLENEIGVAQAELFRPEVNPAAQTQLTTEQSVAVPEVQDSSPAEAPAAPARNGVSAGRDATVQSAGALPASARTQDLAAVVQDGLLGQLRWMPPRGGDFTNTVADLAGLLDLSPAEANEFLGLLQDGQGVIYDKIRESTTITRPSDTELVIAVKDSADAKIAAIFMQERVKQLLGEERYSIYEGIGAKDSIDNMFNNYGLNPITITLTKGFDERRGGITYSMRRQYPGRMGGGGGGSMPRESLGLNLGPIADFIPEDF